MGTFAAAQVIVLPFPFSDLSGHKLRPALLLAEAGRGDWIACQITSNPYADPRAVELGEADFQNGTLQRTSYIRPAKLFTASAALFVSSVGIVNPPTFMRVRDSVIQLLNGDA